MSIPATIDLKELLRPIAGDNPSGESLRYTPIYDAIQEARRADDPNLKQGDWKRDLKVANWREVGKIASEALATKSKDLQIAAWLAEALIKQHGFTGARDGFWMLRELQERFWDTLYPEPEDGDLELRASALESANRQLSPALAELPLTSSAAEKYSLVEWQDSRQVEEAGRKSPEARQALLDEGKITADQWDKAVAAGNRAFYEGLLTEVKESLSEFEKLTAAVDQRFGQGAPSLLDIKRILEECQSLVESIVKKKRELEPDLAIAATSSLEAGHEDVVRPSMANGHAASPQILTVVTEVAARTTALDSAGLVSLEPQDRADALRRLAAIADFFHRSEPHSPVAYLIERAVRWGQMPLEQWLNDVISDQGVLSHIRETLGIKNSEQDGG